MATERHAEVTWHGDLLNGSGTITSADSWTAFYGDTSIINGQLDCNLWGATIP